MAPKVKDPKAKSTEDKKPKKTEKPVKAEKTDKPKAEKPAKAEKPKAEKPAKAEKPKTEKPAKADKPKTEKPAKADKPEKKEKPAKEEKPKEVKPKEEKSKVEKPKAEKRAAEKTEKPAAKKPKKKTAVKSAASGQKDGQQAKKKTRFVLDCKAPVEDGIFQMKDFATFIEERFKIRGKKGPNPALNVEVVKHKLIVSTIDYHFSKKVLKYLAKKYMKKNNLRDWLRVVKPNDHKDVYELRYFNINNDDEAEEDAEE